MSDSCTSYWWIRFGSVLLCFFFFKQKTAYEMRISDWSSDVCSSDLIMAGLVVDSGQPGHETFMFGMQQRINAYQFLCAAGQACAAAALATGEIGRASCRERVCQYV